MKEEVNDSPKLNEAILYLYCLSPVTKDLKGDYLYRRYCSKSFLDNFNVQRGFIGYLPMQTQNELTFLKLSQLKTLNAILKHSAHVGLQCIIFRLDQHHSFLCPLQ